MKVVVAVVAAFAAVALPVASEPVGRWWAGFGQGTFEYGISMPDGDQIYIACSEGSIEPETTISFKLRGAEPEPNSEIVVEIDGERLGLYAEANRKVGTACHACADNFLALVDLAKVGRRMTVRYVDGTSRIFPLTGSSKALSEFACPADFYRPAR